MKLRRTRMVPFLGHPVLLQTIDFALHFYHGQHGSSFNHFDVIGSNYENR